MTFKINGKLPPKEHNGLDVLTEDWHAILDPNPVVAVVILAREDLHLKGPVAVVRVDALAVLEGAPAETARGWLAAAADQYSDGTPLDLPDIDEPELDLDTPLQDGEVV